MTHTNVILPLSLAAVEEIAQQVTARGQGDRVSNHLGAKAVHLSDVTVAAMPRQLAEGTTGLDDVVKENDRLRGIIGHSVMDCIYCGLPAIQQTKCLSGFPGCSRADDQLLFNPYETKGD